MKLSYETRDILIKIGFVTSLIIFVIGVGFSYMECQTKFVEGIISETPTNLEESVKAKMK
jgi:hypothetical protein